ncbi:hypothetical protein, partial [Cupriavidus plantarum]
MNNKAQKHRVAAPVLTLAMTFGLLAGPAVAQTTAGDAAAIVQSATQPLTASPMPAGAALCE